MKTNADRFLRDGVDADDFVGEFNDFISRQTENQSACVGLAQFLKCPAKPKLIEDERVILRNIKEDYKFIGKIKFFGSTFLYTSQKERANDFTTLIAFDHLFQFIQERRRIRDSRTFERRIIMSLKRTLIRNQAKKLYKENTKRS